MTKDTKYLILLSSLYFVVSFLGILHHELWLDEAHHFLLARDSNSLTDLIRNTRMEGHPILWNVLLYGVTRFTANPLGMQLLHILISFSTVIVFLKKAPFNWLFKTLFIFGYFMIFEYNLISRNYGLGVLFVFLACSVFEFRQQKFTLLCLYLAFVLNTHLIFSIVAFALFLTLLLEQLQIKSFFRKEYLAGYAIFSGGLLLLFLQCQTTNSEWLLDRIHQLSFTERAAGGFSSLFKGLVLIPDFRTIHFWNLNLIVSLSKPLAGILSLLSYVVPMLLFFKNRKLLFFVYVTIIGTQFFFFMTHRGAVRFHGVNYILIISALWIEHYFDAEEYKFKSLLKKIKMTGLRKPIIYSILLLHFCSGIYAYSKDFVYPFTSAKETVKYLNKKGAKGKPIVSVTCEGTVLSAYLERKVYFLCNGSLQSYCIWNSTCVGNITTAESTEMLRNFMENHDDVFFVSYYRLPETVAPNRWFDLSSSVRARFMKKFDCSISTDIDYYVYEIQNIKKSQQ